MKPLQIGTLSPSYPWENGDVPSGIATHCHVLMRGFERRGIGYQLVLPQAPYAPNDRILTYPSAPWPKAGPHYRIANLAAKPQIYSILRGTCGHTDIFHVHMPFNPAFTLAREARRRGVPVVWTFHTHYMEYGPIYKPSFVTDQFVEKWLTTHLRWFSRLTSLIIAPSKYTENYIRELGITTPIEVIPTGVPKPLASHVSKSAQLNLRRELGIPHDHLIVCGAGRQGPEKNFELVIRAFAMAASERKNIHLVLAGAEGQSTPGLKQLARDLGIKNQVYFPGLLEPRKLAALFAASEVLLHGSVTETQGLITAEARVCGTPSIVTNMGGSPESIISPGHYGFVLPPEPKAFGSQLLQILSNTELRKKLNRRCLAWTYTPDDMVTKTLETYENLLSS